MSIVQFLSHERAWVGKGWDRLHDSRTAAGIEKGRVIMAMQAALSRKYIHTWMKS
jgi:hypothetical protein